MKIYLQNGQNIFKNLVTSPDLSQGKEREGVKNLVTEMFHSNYSKIVTIKIIF